MPLYEDLFSFTGDFLVIPGNTSRDRGSKSSPLKNEGGDGTESLSFLERFTRNVGLVASFDCLDAATRIAIRDELQQSLPQQRDLDDPLKAKSQEIVCLIEEVVRIRPRNSVVSLSWNTDVRDACIVFFSPSRLRLYVELYWQIWHANVNFLHRPTFQIKNSKAGLVAAMAIIGARVSPDRSDIEAAEPWLNCVEEMVFQDDDFCRDENDDEFPSLSRIQSLQAAYIVCLFQNWEGQDASKRRIRRFRFNTLISVARDIGMHHVRQLDVLEIGFENFSWADFALREQLIRTLLWIFLLDTAFVIFHNSPPRMAIMEMKVQFASNEASFQAGSADTCYGHLRSSTYSTEDLLLSSVTRILCRGPMLESMLLSRIADLGSLNLFVLTSALHSMIFQVQQSFGHDLHMSPIKHALANWNNVWQLYATEYSTTTSHRPLPGGNPPHDQLWRRIGFSRFAHEYWLLASLISSRITAAAEAVSDHQTVTQAEGSRFDVGDPDDQKELKYDETSMQQVNELISELQRVAID